MEKQTSATTEQMEKNENIILLPQCLTSTPKSTHENIELAIYPNNPVKLTIAHTLFCGAISTAITPVSTCYNAPICLDHFFQSDPIFKMNMLINTSTHI